FTVGENLLDLRPEFARFRIDELQFLLDPESENVIGSPKSRRRFLYFARGVLLSRGNIHRSSAESMVIVTFVLGADSPPFAIYSLFFVSWCLQYRCSFSLCLDCFGNLRRRPRVASPNPFDPAIAVDQGSRQSM